MSKNIFSRTLLLTLYLSSASNFASAQESIIQSPGKRIAVQFVPSANGALTYTVKVKGQTAIEPSSLGISVDGQNLGQGATLGTPLKRRFKESYPMMGAHPKALNSYREAIFPVQCGPGKPSWQLEVRVFDDGMAIRYRVPMQGQHKIDGESSTWKLPEGSTVWYQTNTNIYEQPFLERPVKELTSGSVVGAPMTVKLPQSLGYAFLSEANTVKYSDMALKIHGERTISASFDKDSTGWTNQGEILSPWRVTILAADLNGLVNSDMIRNLCPPPMPELANAAWIKPGRSNWHWMVTGRPKLEAQHQWVDSTQQLGFEYYLIDDGWRDWSSEGKGAWDTMQDVVNYATKRGVKIWAWVDSKEVFSSPDRKAYFQKAKDTGVVGLKIDFPQRPDTTWIQWYDDTVQDAAKYQLMIDFHGAVKPSGRERTWPNDMTREAIRGREYGKLPGSHDAALPFTRYVQGPADFTPTDFRTDRLGGSSWSHELAQAIVYTSPFLCYGGSPEDYLQNPGVDMLKAIPSTWDETVVLPGSEIGRIAAFARRKGKEWFVGVVNGDEARPFKIALSFLEKGQYRCDMMSDLVDNHAGWDRTQKAVWNKDSLSFSVRSNGGFVAHLTQATR